MKVTSTLRAMAFGFMALSIFACGDDDDTKNVETVENQFTVDQNKVAVEMATFYYDTTPSNSDVDGKPYYRHWVNLFGAGFTVGEHQVYGEGNMVDLAISGASANLDPGTYTFTGTEDNAKAFELWDGRIEYNKVEYIFTASTLKIGKSGDTYTIEVTAKAYPQQEEKTWLPDLTKTPVTLNGYFSGPIVSIEQD